MYPPGIRTVQTGNNHGRGNSTPAPISQYKVSTTQSCPSVTGVIYTQERVRGVWIRSPIKRRDMCCWVTTRTQCGWRLYTTTPTRGNPLPQADVCGRQRDRVTLRVCWRKQHICRARKSEHECNSAEVVESFHYKLKYGAFLCGCQVGVDCLPKRGDTLGGTRWVVAGVGVVPPPRCHLVGNFFCLCK